MKIAVLSRNRHLYSTRRLVEEGINRGHEVKVIDCLHCSMNITSANPQIHYHEEVLEDFDVVIPRIGASVTFYGTAVLRQFEMMGVFPVNESVAITRSRDKLRSLQLLARKGVGMPVTGFQRYCRQAWNASVSLSRDTYVIFLRPVASTVYVSVSVSPSGTTFPSRPERKQGCRTCSGCPGTVTEWSGSRANVCGWKSCSSAPTAP